MTLRGTSGRVCQLAALLALAAWAPAAVRAQAAAPSAADEPPAPEAPPPAADPRERGRALVAEGRFDEAQRVYLEALDAGGAPDLLVDLADARLAAGDGPGAVEALERFVARAGEGEPAAAARARIAEIQAMPAVLNVTTTPEGAEVRIDGEVAGTTPLHVEVAPGEHAVEVALVGPASASDTVVVAFASTRTLELALAPDVSAEATAEAAPLPAEEPAIERDTSASPAIWVTASIAAAGLLTGTIFGFKALSEESDFVIAPTESGADRGETYALVADIGFGVAAASAITALVLWVRGDETGTQVDGRASAPRVRVVGAARGTGLGAQVEF